MLNSPHESTDVNVKGIKWVTIISIFSMIVMFIGLWAIFFYFRSFEYEKITPANIIAERTKPPEPRLEMNPRAKNKESIIKERQLLNSYKWLDKDNDIVRVPLRKAIEILLYE